MKKSYFLSAIVSFVFSGALFGQAVPELIYYKFDDGNLIVNSASSPVGVNPTLLMGTDLSIGGTGMFGTALMGTGGQGGVSRLSTGWPTSLNSSFTIGFWSDSIVQSTSLWYAFGDNLNASIRCFTNGSAGSSNWRLTCNTCGLPSVTAFNGATSGAYTHFVYDESASMVRAYVNGVRVDSATVNGPVSISGNDFCVGAYQLGDGINGKMDEFRLYNRALSQAEILATYNIELFYCPEPTNLQTDSVGCDQVMVSWDSDSGTISSRIEYAQAGVTSGSSTIVNATSNPFTITGLQSGAIYDVYVIDSCQGGTSLKSDKLQFTTTDKPNAFFNSFNMGVSSNGAHFEFNATNTTDAQTYNWIFGDGNTGNGVVVSHFYMSNATFDVTLIAEGHCGADTMIQQVSVNGISVNSWESQDFKAFPNPVNDVIFIKAPPQSEMTYNVSLIDMYGNVVFVDTELKGNAKINVNHLASGMYILHIENEAGSLKRNVKKL